MILVKRVLEHKVLLHSIGQEIADGEQEEYKISG